MALLTQAQVFALFKSVEAFDDTKPFANYTAAEAYFSDRLGFAVPRSSLSAACKTTGKKVVRGMAQKAKGNSDLVKAIADVHGRVDHLGQRLDNLQIAFTNATASYRNFVQKEVADRLTALEESARTASCNQKYLTLEAQCQSVFNQVRKLEEVVDERSIKGDQWVSMVGERISEITSRLADLEGPI